MNTNQLKYFVSAAEARSFTKAAEQHYVSQTAVTQQIHLLEETLGCRLFDRTTRPVSLTPAGRTFLIEAKAILERMSRAVDRVHDASTGLIGTLRVGYVRGYERSDLSVLMRYYHESHANVRERYVFLARVLDKRPFDVIGVQLGLSYKGAAAVYYRAIRKLKKSIEGVNGYDI